MQMFFKLVMGKSEVRSRKTEVSYPTSDFGLRTSDFGPNNKL